MPISPHMSDGEVLAKQEEIFYSSVLRTCTVPMGRAAFYFSARKPLATEKYPIPRLNFTVILKPRDVTITLQKTEYLKKICLGDIFIMVFLQDFLCLRLRHVLMVTGLYSISHNT